jgi:NAD(P)-dependent dehydrogenase (short-subunit alcohol dehydrogenase family)
METELAKIFRERVALVTGAASGIGAATALELALRGAAVVAVDRDESGLELTQAAIQAAGGSAAVFVGDIGQEATAEAMVALAVERFGALHLAVNNAGVGGRPGPLDQLATEDWRRVMDVNLDGVFFGMRHELRAILAAGGGAIVNVASVFAGLGQPRMDTYSASKHAVLGLSRSAALEYAPRGIRINVVSPGVIATGLTATSEAAKRWAAKSPLNRMGQPKELAKAIAFLLSEDASFVVGANLLVDGGFVLT